MKAVVVYELLWGNTATIARAIAEGIGMGTRALSTAEASAVLMAHVDLLVAGSPVLGFSLPTESMRETIRTRPGKAPAPPDLSHPSMRSWLAALPKQTGYAGAFETRIWWSPGGATGAILAGLADAGYRTLGKGQRFIVSGPYGPLREGEVERARLWGAELAQFVVRDG